MERPSPPGACISLPGPCKTSKQAMVTCIPKYAPHLCIASFPTTLLVRAVSSLNSLPIATTTYALCPNMEGH
ncbi:uncharacterized protein K444DRAFT_617263 [Hyaloscypha bicolor E]|uniref:Uncharacterized protein n=1 Tax=Hyaloscypha bicolor E TaxID=1095630 RepID=A0A2J6SXT8_9HELO|nr:uncharacterized protein K444DRAFT_617263 [Hyaloscypha bicolor E]PMD55585.1 hypothetical protein K444DRAFT_617263 [Hyaloscypha bicolor E]